MQVTAVVRRLFLLLDAQAFAVIQVGAGYVYYTYQAPGTHFFFWLYVQVVYCCCCYLQVPAVICRTLLACYRCAVFVWLFAGRRGYLQVIAVIRGLLPSYFVMQVILLLILLQVVDS